jgi:small subunit ribosomal protein S18
MARGGGGGDRDRRRSPKDTGRRTAKKKVCVFCSDHIKWVDYKDVNLLRRFMSDRGKIRARRVSGNCAQHQRDVAVAIKTARELALLPYSQRTVAERGGGRGRGPREDRDDRPPRRDVEVEANGEAEVDAGPTDVGEGLTEVEGESPGRAELPETADIEADLEGAGDADEEAGE